MASVLQTQINLADEGWVPSAGFSVGCLLVAVCIAAVQVYTRTDVAYALASLWALTGIVTQQSEGSTFGCSTLICNACADVQTSTEIK